MDTNRDRRRFNVAVIIGIMAIAFLLAIAILWWTPIPSPWNLLLAWAVAVGVGLWGSKLLLRVRAVEPKDAGASADT